MRGKDCIMVLLLSVVVVTAEDRTLPSDSATKMSVNGTADAALTAGLVGTWKVRWSKNGWEATRTFNNDGTFTSSDAGPGIWTIMDQTIVLSFRNYKERFELPLKPDGTKVVGWKDRELLATKLDLPKTTAQSEMAPPPTVSPIAPAKAAQTPQPIIPTPATPRAVQTPPASTPSPASVQQPAPKRPIGVPEDAKFFNGKWYRVYLEKATWNQARRRCLSLKGQIVVVPDEATRAFIQQIATGRQLWLGATNEHSQLGKWKWVDGTPMKFEAWDQGQPSSGNEHYLEVWKANGLWNDGVENDSGVVGYICEWKQN